MNQAAQQKSGTSTVGCIATSVGVLVLVGAAGVGGYFLLQGAHQEGGYVAVAGPWGGGSGGPFTCGGNDERTLEGVTATLDTGPALSVGGNCRLTLIDCNVTAPTVISASGNAQVTIRGGSIHGTTTAVSASGNAHVTFEGASVVGAIDRSGSAQVTGAP